MSRDTLFAKYIAAELLRSDDLSDVSEPLLHAVLYFAKRCALWRMYNTSEQVEPRASPPPFDGALYANYVRRADEHSTFWGNHAWSDDAQALLDALYAYAHVEPDEDQSVTVLKAMAPTLAPSTGLEEDKAWWDRVSAIMPDVIDSTALLHVYDIALALHAGKHKKRVDAKDVDHSSRLGPPAPFVAKYIHPPKGRMPSGGTVPWFSRFVRSKSGKSTYIKSPKVSQE